LTAIKPRTEHRSRSKRLGLLLGFGILVSGLLGDISAFAEGITGKIPLPPRRPASLGVTPVAPDTPVPTEPQKPAPVKPAVIPADLSPEELLTMINEALTNLKQFSAKFSQISGNGQQTSGRLTVVRPGRLRFDYNPPSTITIIADGSSVAVIDSKLNTQDVYSIGLTPLKFLLGGSINLARDFKVSDVVNEGERIAVYAEDSSTFGGTSRIELGFDPKNLLLKQWSVTDPQGYVVTVTLSTIDTKHEPDMAQFYIPENPDKSRKK
jgi:outer membrane lipoprotein-sorting protein